VCPFVAVSWGMCVQKAGRIDGSVSERQLVLMLCSHVAQVFWSTAPDMCCAGCCCPACSATAHQEEQRQDPITPCLGGRLTHRVTLRL
jgi:hypothetical protein